MAWSVLQSASANFPGGTSFFPAATYGSNVSSGTKLLCILAAITPLADINAVGDGASGGGNQLTLVASYDGGGTWPTLAIYAMDTPAGDVGTTPTITASLANKSNCAVLVQEVSGLAAGTSGITDGTAGNTNNSTGTPPGASMGPPAYSSSAAGEYLVYLYSDDEGNAATSNVYTWTAPAGYTADAASLNTQGTGKSFINNLGVAYENSTGGTESGTWSATGTGSAHWSELMVAFKLPAPVIMSGPALPSRFMGQRPVTVVTNAGWRGAQHSR